MEQAAIFSPRIRRLAVVTGIASALALFPIFFLLYPALLIAGGIIQPRYPTAGKWFVWAGAANLWVVVIVYDSMMFPHHWRPSENPESMVLPFAVTTVLLIWCTVELIADAILRLRVRSTTPATAPLPVSRGVWIVLAALNLLIGWEVVGWALAPKVYRSSENLYSTLAMSIGQVATVIALDISLLRKIVKLGPLDSDGTK